MQTTNDEMTAAKNRNPIISAPAIAPSPKNASTTVSLFIVLLALVYGCHIRYMGITQTVVDTPIRADASDYFYYAENIHSLGIYSRAHNFESPSLPQPDALRAPGFPFFASIFMSATPYSAVKQTLIAQTFLQIVAFCLLTLVFLRTLQPTLAAIACFAVWSFPHFVTINTYYLSESLFTSLLLLSGFTLWASDTGKNTKALIACGLLFGLAALTRSVVEYFPIFILALTCLFSREHFKNVLVFSTAAIIPIAAWKARNLLAIGHTSDATLMLNALYHGSFPDFMYNGDPNSFGAPYRFDPDSEKVYNGLEATLNVIWNRATNNLTEYIAWYTFGKQVYMWSWSIVAGAGDIFIYPIIESPYLRLPDMIFSRAVHHFSHPFWVVFGLFSAAFFSTYNLRHNKITHPPTLVIGCSLLIVYIVLITAITAPYPRYAIPFKWILIFLSIYSIQVFSIWLHKMIQTQKFA
ncbi:MAG: hypothetical protein P8Y42_03475 [Exilibacterium sp.]